MFECDKCGLCCRHLIIEVTDIDVAREPKIALHADPFRRDGVVLLDEDGEEAEPLVPGWERGGLLACGAGMPCFALGGDNACGIYSTRPNECVAFQAGSEKCQDLRRDHGLDELQPTSRRPLPLVR